MMVKSLIWILSIPTIIISQQVSLQGVVVQENGQPIQGATVVVKQRSNLSDQTDTQGNFDISGTGTPVILSFTEPFKKFSITKSHINFQSIQNHQNIKLIIFGEDGHVYLEINKFPAATKTYSIDITDVLNHDGRYILRWVLDNKTVFQKAIRQNSQWQWWKSSRIKKTETPALRKFSLQLIDTLLVSATGYHSKQVGIEDYTLPDLRIVLFAPVSNNTWGLREPLPALNSETAVASLDGKIYVIGGYPSSRNTVNTVQVYNTMDNTWKIVDPLPVPLNHAMAAEAGGKVYLIGGQTNTGSAYVNTIYEYDPQLDNWVSKTTMPTARSAGATAVVGDKIYVAGGRPPQGNDFAVYDVSENSWETLPDLPTARNHIAAAAINGKVYVVGGRFGSGFGSEMTDVLEIFDPSGNNWSIGAPMPTVRGGISGVAANGCFHVFGGEGPNNFPNQVFPQHEVYNPISNTWQGMDNLPIPVHGVTGAAFIDNFIYLPGGGTSSGGSSGSEYMQFFYTEMVCE